MGWQCGAAVRDTSAVPFRFSSWQQHKLYVFTKATSGPPLNCLPHADASQWTNFTGCRSSQQPTTSWWPTNQRTSTTEWWQTTDTAPGQQTGWAGVLAVTLLEQAITMQQVNTTVCQETWGPKLSTQCSKENSRLGWRRIFPYSISTFSDSFYMYQLVFL